MSREQWMPSVQVLDQSANAVEFKLNFSPQLEIYKGHFPEFSITPGVVLTHVAVSLMSDYLKLNGYPVDFPSVKFMSPIVPDTDVHLYLEYFKEKKILQFEYKFADKIYSKGSLKVEEEHG